MKTIKFSVPPTREQGSHTGTCSASNGETLAASAPWYVQRKDGRTVETVDEFDTRKEALAMVKEYRIADPSADHYLSRRPCAGWND